MNTHGFPDTLLETMAIDYDLLPACIIATSGLTTPGSGLSLTVSAKGYVRSGTTLTYVDQPARAVTLPNSNGTYWLVLTKDTHATLAGYTRIPGAHYAFIQSATQPAVPDGGAFIASAVVVSPNITTVTPVLSPPLSRQNANAVVITGGVITGLTALNVASPGNQWAISVPDAGAGTLGGYLSSVTSGTNRWNFYADGTAPNFFAGAVGIGTAPPSYPLDVTGNVRVMGLLGLGRTPGASQVEARYTRATQSALQITPTADSGPGAALAFLNAAGTLVGSITTTGAATAYSTSSDVRLKHAVQALSGALAAIQALRPVQFRWNATDEQDIGFLAHELMTVAPNAVSGLPDEVNADGTIKPQQVDQSKLIPILVAAIKELLARVETLEQALA